MTKYHLIDSDGRHLHVGTKAECEAAAERHGNVGHIEPCGTMHACQLAENLRGESGTYDAITSLSMIQQLAGF